MRLPLASAALALAVASAALAAPVANQWGLSLVSLSGGGISEIVTGSFTTDAAGGIIDWDLLATGDFMLGFSSVDGSLDASSASGFSLLDGSGSSLTVSFGAALDGVISPDQVSTASAVLSGTVVAGGA